MLPAQPVPLSHRPLLFDRRRFLLRRRLKLIEMSARMKLCTIRFVPLLVGTVSAFAAEKCIDAPAATVKFQASMLKVGVESCKDVAAFSGYCSHEKAKEFCCETCNSADEPGSELDGCSKVPRNSSAPPLPSLR